MIKTRALAFALLCLTAFSGHAFAADKTWTVLVYLNGFNDLDAAGKLNLNQMETVGSSDQVNMVVEWGSYSDKTSTKRMLMQKDTDMSKITTPVLQELGKVDMGSPETLKDFLLWGTQNFPAQHYMVVVWDHGSGWHIVNPARAGSVHAQDISWDDYSGNAITTEELGRVIREVSQSLGRKIDIFSTDACLMAMAEVAGEMSGAVDFFAGSEELEPENGWPYDVILGQLVAHPEMSPKEFSTFVASSYVKSYNGSDDVTYSVFEMSHFAQFEAAMADLGSQLSSLNKSERAATLKTVNATQSFYGDYGDLGDFVRRLQGQVNIKSSVIMNVQQALQGLVAANFMTSKYPNATGLAVWLPADQETYDTYSKRYAGLNFAKNAHWSQAISTYLH